MADFNLNSSLPPTFILNGIPGLEDTHIWISVPFSMFYIFCLGANLTVLLVIHKEQTLHKPMYILLCMLAFTDITISTCIMPKALVILWFGFKDITLDGCLTQMFFVYLVTGMHSVILVTMGFDRYIAISEPLRYESILTNTRTSMLVVLGSTRSGVLVLPSILMVRRLPFCANRIIHHTYCEHMAVLKLSCGDTTVNQRYALVAMLVTTLLDLTLIVFSYGLIIRAVLRISSKKSYRKALNTCTAHICVIMMAYTSAIFTSLTHRFGKAIGAHIHILLANLYLLIPSMLNPIIYGVTMKELREKVGKYICSM